MKLGRSLYGLASAVLSAACLALIVTTPVPAAAHIGGSGTALTQGDGGAVGPALLARDVVVAPPRVTVVRRHVRMAAVSRASLGLASPVGRLRDFSAPPDPWSGSPLFLRVGLYTTPPAD